MNRPLDQTEFARDIRSGHTQFLAGCYDAMSGLLAEKAGFKAVMSSGFAVSAAHLGFPDVELYTMTENLTVVRNICGAVSIPVIADTDTGYGNAINIMRTVREFENAGVSGMIFEDQLSPKKCAACANRIELLGVEEAVGKIRAAVEARQNPDTIIIARTDEVDEDAAIARAKLYVEAGADLIQPISRCFKDIGGLRRLREACGVPLSLQILGWLESDLSADDIKEVAGLACYPLVGLMSAAKVLQDNFSALAIDLGTKNLPQPKMSMDEFKSFIGFTEVEQQQERFLLTE
tara:strand:+ start:783 stop:1655 length:873 start_codon:yes stop_codon:yes gene_type:complete